MKKIYLALIASAGLFTVTTTPAFASDEGWYVYGAAGQVINNNDKATMDNALISVGGAGFASSMNNPTVYKLDVGYQFNENFALEGGYNGSSNESYTAAGGNLVGPVSATAKVDGWDVSAVGILPMASQFSLLGKLGVSNMHTSATLTGPGGIASASGNKTAITYGIGAKYDFTASTALRFNVDRLKTGSSSSSSYNSVWTLGLAYKF